MNAITQGNEVVLSASFSNEGGTMADPTAVVCRVRDPTGAITTPTATKVDMGVWTVTFPVGAPGKWEYGFFGSGAIVAASESVFWVANSNLI